MGVTTKLVDAIGRTHDSAYGHIKEFGVRISGDVVSWSYKMLVHRDQETAASPRSIDVDNPVLSFLPEDLPEADRAIVDRCKGELLGVFYRNLQSRHQDMSTTPVLSPEMAAMKSKMQSRQDAIGRQIFVSHSELSNDL